MSEGKDKRGRLNPGSGTAIGAGIGVALFAATDQPVWIAVGVALGAGVGSRDQSKDDDG